MNHKGQFQSDIPVEALTAREKEVLLLLTDHLRYQDIAERLTLALSSVKWYVQQIYSKLGVNNRRDAIERARASGMLSAPPDERSTSDTQPSHNLPHPLTRFIGREKEMIEIEDLIRQNPLVTLIGSGGVGKTRLALQVSRQVVPHFSQGVWQVELAPIVNPDLVPHAVAAVLGVQEIPSHSLTESLLYALREKQVLLVLDNCEHLLDGVARLVEKLLSGCPNLAVLATSRETIGVPGEVVYRVPSLSFPENIGRPTISAMLAYDAVDLFIDRAIKVQPGFRLTQENCLAVTNICCRLDGIPLAIELAAARTRVMSPQQIAARMDNVFRLLTGSRRSGLPRQQTLKATIDWSYALLNEKERQALQRFSVFAGNWALDAAESVAAGGDIEPGEILDLLTSLVDKSLVQAYPTPDGLIRYRILETVRQYAYERLVESGGEEIVHDRHLDFYLKLAERAAPHLRGKGASDWMDRLELEYENLRLALGRALFGHIEEGLRLASSLQWFWQPRSFQTDGVAWLDQILAAEAENRGSALLEVGAQSTLYLRAWCSAIVALSELSAYNSGSLFLSDKRVVLLDQCILICRSIGREASRELACALMGKATWSFAINKKGADIYLDEAMEICWKNGYRQIESEVLWIKLNIAMRWGEYRQAKEFLETSLSICREVEDRDGAGSRLTTLSWFEKIAGNQGKAISLFREGVGYWQKIGNSLAYDAIMSDFLEIQYDTESIVQTERALQRLKEAQNIPSYITGLAVYLKVLWSEGNFDRADVLIKEAEKIIKSQSSYSYDEFTLGYPLWLGRIALTKGDRNLAMGYFKMVFKWWNNETEIPIIQVQLLDSLGAWFLSEGRAVEAVRSFAAIDELYNRFIPSLPLRMVKEHDAALKYMRVALGEASFGEIWAAGQALTPWEALEEVKKIDEQGEKPGWSDQSGSSIPIF